MVTKACNLNCSYCYERFKTKEYMTLDMAKSIVEKEFAFVAESPDYDELQLDFIGGEPLMAFPLIRDLCEWVWSRPQPVPYICFATTNGTLLQGEVREWFEKHRERFWLGASYDGETSQMTNRGKLSGSADLDFFHYCWPRQGFKMTISRESLPHVAADVKAMLRKGYFLNASLAHGIAWTEEDAASFETQLEELRLFYLSAEYAELVQKYGDLVAPVLLEREPISIAYPRPGQSKFCGTGTAMVCYDVDGTPYPCHLFTPVVQGYSKSLPVGKLNFCDDENFEEPRCKNCCLKGWCPSCYGFNYQLRGDVKKRPEYSCRMYYVQALKTCQFILAHYEKEGVINTTADAQELETALKAFENLKSYTGGMLSPVEIPR